MERLNFWLLQIKTQGGMTSAPLRFLSFLKGYKGTVLSMYSKGPSSFTASSAAALAKIIDDISSFSEAIDTAWPPATRDQALAAVQSTPAWAEIMKISDEIGPVIQEMQGWSVNGAPAGGPAKKGNAGLVLAAVAGVVAFMSLK